MKKRIGKVELAWEETGQGPPVVLLHAFPLNRRMWEPQRGELSGRYRIVTPDFRGHGESALPDEDSTMERLAEDVRGLLDELGLERVVLGGLSMGGYVAFAFLRKHAARLAGLILADTRAAADSEEGRQGRYENAGLAEKEGSAALADRLLPKLLAPASQGGPVARAARELMLSTPPAGMARALRGMAVRPDSTALLGRIQVPTLVVVGEQDPLSPPAEAEAMAQSIPNAKLVRIPNAGHLSNLEQPTAFTNALEEFLAQFSSF